MADAVNITPRPLYLEDLAVSVLPRQTVANVPVLGAGLTTLTAIPITLLTQLVVAANDTAAGIAGVGIGGVYLNSTSNALHTRMS